MDYAPFQITERRCKICMSSHREKIDEMLQGIAESEDGRRYRYADIIDWAALRGLELSSASLSRHWHGHVQPSIRHMLETQAQMDAIERATGKKLSLHAVFANVVTGKVLRLLEELDEEDLKKLDVEKLLRVALMAGRNSLHIEKAERLLNQETADQVSAKLKGQGLSEEVIREIEETILGLQR